MKRFLLLLLAVCGSHAAPIHPAYAEKIADAIYRVEGGARARVPYGVLSVKVDGAGEARRVCLRSIANNWARWEQAGQPDDFIHFMADRWCPPSVDPVGNRNWKKNMKALIK